MLRRLSHVFVATIIIIVLAMLHRLTTQAVPSTTQGPKWHEDAVLESSTRSSIGQTYNNVAVSTNLLTMEYRAGAPKVPGSNYSQVLVVPRLRNDNVSWIERELPGINTAVYVANEPTAKSHPPLNKGHEVMIYLTYIIDHYFSLPDIIIFMHAHRWTHHNIELLSYDSAAMVRRLSHAYVAREGYVNMRCRWYPGCPEWLHPADTRDVIGKQEGVVLSQCWRELFPSEPIPSALGQGCCAQFAVSKVRVLSIPLSRFVFYRDWILKTPLNDYVSGRIWEYLWQYLFTGDGIYCPSENACHCQAFGVCLGDDSEYSEFERLRHMKENYEAEMKEFREHSLVTDGTEKETWQSERYLNLSEQVKTLDTELRARTQKAIELGESLDNRAALTDQGWRDQGGF